jgi:hypothetical protein
VKLKTLTLYADPVIIALNVKVKTAILQTDSLFNSSGANKNWYSNAVNYGD